MDKLIINEIKLSTLIGIHPWEQQCPQTLILDLAFQTSLQEIAHHDNIECAIDYDKVLQFIFDFVKNHHFQLLETLAHKLAQALQVHFLLPWLQMTLSKPGATLQAKNISVTLERVYHEITPSLP